MKDLKLSKNEILELERIVAIFKDYGKLNDWKEKLILESLTNKINKIYKDILEDKRLEHKDILTYNN